MHKPAAVGVGAERKREKGARGWARWARLLGQRGGGGEGGGEGEVCARGREGVGCAVPGGGGDRGSLRKVIKGGACMCTSVYNCVWVRERELWVRDNSIFKLNVGF